MRTRFTVHLHISTWPKNRGRICRNISISTPLSGCPERLFSSCGHPLSPGSSERLQVLDKIPLFLLGQAQPQRRVIVADHVTQRLRTSVVEIRRMLPEGAQRGGPIAARNGA